MTKYFGENIWVNATLAQEGHFIISDVRFKKEANAIHDMGGKIILIERPNSGNNSNHISEKEWVEMKKEGVYDYIIENTGTEKDLFNAIKKLARKL